MINKKTFCILPWTHIHLNTEGDVFPCCISWTPDRNSRIGWLKDSSLEELFNHDKMKQLRLDMLNGVERPDICKGCYDRENGGFASARQGYNNDMPYDKTIELIKKTKNDGYVEPIISSWDIRFNNLCNLKCRSCGPLFSTTWAQEDKKFSHNRINSIEDGKDPLENQYENVQKIYFAGGEPLIMAEHFRTLDELIKRNKAKDIQLIYNSNMTKLDYKNHNLLDYWREFKSVNVGVSIDAVGKRAEYIRHGASWNTIEENLRTLMRFKDQSNNFGFYYSPTVSIFNIHHLCEMHQYLWDNQLMPNIEAMSFNILLHPVHYDCRNLTTNLKNEVKAKILGHLKWLKAYNSHDSIIQQFETLHKYVDEPLDRSYAHEFLKKTLELDKIRNENFSETFPEYSDMLTDLLINNTKFCVLPWIHLHSWPNGSTYLCCVSADGSDDKTKIGDITENSISEIMNGDRMKSIRKAMLSNESVHNCSKCIQMEEFKGFSWRSGFNHQFREYIDKLVRSTNNDGSINPKLLYIDFRFSNACNLECRSCGANLSSSIASAPGREFSNGEIDEFSNKRVISGTNLVAFMNAKPDFFEDDLKNYLQDTVCFYFAGGEPLIQKEHYDILSYIDTQQWYNRELRYSTNLSTLIFKGTDFVELWKKFDKVWVMCSIDHFGDKLEYLRQNVNHERLFKNLEKLFNNNFQVSITMVVSVYNIYYLYEFFEFLHKKKYLKHLYSIDILYAFGDDKSPGVLPNWAKDELIIKLKEDQSSKLYKNIGKQFNQFNDSIKGLIDFINSSTSCTFDEFINITTRYDKIYKKSVMTTFPWLGNVINRYQDQKND